jgi:hypothetical protein
MKTITNEQIRQNAYDHITNLGTGKPKLLSLMGNLDGCRQQGNVFGAEATTRFTCNPYPIGTAEHEWFDAGWLDEQEELCGEP